MRVTNLAIDVANYTKIPVPNQCACLLQNDYTLAIVGVSYGVVAGPQIQAFLDGGLEVEAYGWVSFEATWQQPLDRALALIQNYPIKRFWLDCEGPTHGASDGAVVARINAAVGYVQTKRPDLVVGIYTGCWWWNPNTGDSDAFKQLPLWIASYVTDATNPPLDETPPLCGGWTQAAVWQYAGTVQTCGLNTDRNIVFQQEEVEDMAITLALTFVPNQGVRLYVLGQAAPVWITNPQQAADLQRAFGAPKTLDWGTLFALGAR